VYDTEAEKEAWIYGLPGDTDFKEREAITGEDIM
jgi:hypothetical protein